MNTLKPLLFVGFLFFLATATGCKKRQEKKAQQELTASIEESNLNGSYQWEYSINQSGNTSHNLTDHFGIVITSNGQFDYYKNDQLLFSDFVKSVVTSNGVVSFSLQSKIEISGKLTGSTLKIVSKNSATKVPYSNYQQPQYYNGNVVLMTEIVLSNIYTKL